MVVRRQAVVERREDRADRPSINAAISMAANAAINGAGVEARSTADAEQAFAERAPQDLRAAVVENDEVKFLRSVELAFPPRPRDELRID